MLKYLRIITFLFLSFSSSHAQHDIKDYQGNWEGTLPNVNSFNFSITIESLQSNTYNLTITNHESSVIRKLTSKTDDYIQISIDEKTHINVSLNSKATKLTGFITSGILMYHIELKKVKKNIFKGTWNPFMIDNLKSQSIFLSVESNEDGSFAIYPFFGDQRFTGTWCGFFVKKDNIVLFSDQKTGLNFRAALLGEKIRLEILLSDTVIAITDLSRSKTEWVWGVYDSSQTQSVNKPIQLDDGWITTRLQDFGMEPQHLIRMIDSINEKSLGNTHSVLIAKEGNLVFEAYFDEFNVNIPHDQRSASKSISSAMIGIAIDENIIESVNQKAYDCFPEEYKFTKDSLKGRIRIKDLLTMSSGLDAIDFGINRNSAASEDSYQSSTNWLKTVLEAPMINEPGTQAYYGSANPFLLGVCLNEQLEDSLELYMDQKLLAPLGISNYIIQTERTATTPYFGGGMYLTPRDMLKFGQLFLNEGQWKGKQIISKKWVKASFEKYLHLENVRDKNEYGYLWWHKTYIVKDNVIKSIEARGAGGQYIFVIPQLEAVIVITSGNFNEKFQQPEKILEDYILPAILD